MKSTKLFATLVATTLFAACTQEEIFEVENFPQEMEEIVGAKLVGSNVSMNVSMGENTTRWGGGDAKWEKEDIVGLGWVVNTNATTTQEKDKQPDNSRLYANHKYNYDEQAKAWSTYGNLYEGWHFAYFPWSYEPKVAQKVFEVNPAQTTNDQKRRYSERLFISSRKFIDATSLDPETNILETQFAMLPAVKAIRVKTKPAATSSFATVDKMKNLSIDYIEINTGDEAVKPFAKDGIKLYAKNIPAHNDEKDYSELLYKNIYGTNVNKNIFIVEDFCSTLKTDLTYEVEGKTENVFKVSDDTRIITYAVPATATLDIEKVSIKIGVGGEAGGYFLINNKDEKNLSVLEKLVDAYKADGVMKEMDANDAAGNWAMDLEIELYDDIFFTDFKNIETFTQWKNAVDLVDILGRKTENFEIAGKIKFEDGIYMPKSCVLNVSRKDKTDATVGTQCFELQGTHTGEWPANLNPTGIRVYIAKDAVVENAHTIEASNILNEGVLNVPAETILGKEGYTLFNYGTINLLGSEDEKKKAADLVYVDNRNGVVNLVYGSFVTNASVAGTDFGKIVYTVTEKDKANPNRIQNVINTSGNAEGHANVNVLKFEKDNIESFNFTKPGDKIDGNPDPYNPTADEIIKPEALKKLEGVSLEINGVAVESDIAVTVNNVVLKGTGATLTNVNVKNGLNVQDACKVVCQTITGGVTSDGDIQAITINGNVKANDNIITATTINGDVDATNSEVTATSISGNVTLNGKSDINGTEFKSNVTVETGVTTLNNVRINGKMTIKSGAQVILNNKSTATSVKEIENYGTLKSNCDINVTNVALNPGSWTTLDSDPEIVGFDKVIYYTGTYTNDNMTLQGKVAKFEMAAFITALENVEDGDVIKASSDLEFTNWNDLNTNNKEYILDLNGNTLKITNDKVYGYNNAAKKLTIKNGKIIGRIFIKDINVSFENVKFETYKANITNTGSYGNLGIIYISSGANVTLKNCIVQTDGRHLEAEEANSKITIDGCKFIDCGGPAIPYINPRTSGGDVVIKDCVFETGVACEIYDQESMYTVTGNTFAKYFGFSAPVDNAAGLSDACKAFCNNAFAKNTLNTISVLSTTLGAEFYINK